MRLRLFAICAALLAIELAFLPLPGIEQDEALFVAPFLRNNPALYSWHIGTLAVPVMSMSYLSALKSWLYWPVFRLWQPSVWSMRLPECFITILILVLFADLARRISSARVAIAASLFLATDAVFIFSNIFDTTASIELLGVIAFLNLLVRRRFTAAFFVAGLALWSKAIFVFPMAGIAVAFALIYPHVIRKALTIRNLALSAIALLVGAAPLIDYNLRNQGATFRASASLISVPPAEKVLMMRRTLDGRAYEHFMFRSTANEVLPLQGDSLGELALRWYHDSAFHPGSFLLPALCAALLALPFLRGSPLLRPVLFSWVAFAGTFGTMFLLADAGAGPHHTVLVYPAPHFIVAATAAAIWERVHSRSAAAFGIVCALVAGSGVWLLGQYYRAGIHNGFSTFWSDGLSNLAPQAQAERRPVVVLDWGIHNGLQIETGDRVDISEDASPRESVLYVGHCPGYVTDPSRDREFRHILSTSGFHIAGAHSVPDRQGHPVFCVFQVESAQAGPWAK